MICILCLNSSIEAIHIFKEQGLNLDVSSIIVKHFWLQPSEEDSNAQIICYSCWNVLDSFHKFYKKIEAAHLGLITHGSILEAKFKEERESDGDVLDDAYTTDFFPEDFKLEVEESVVSVPPDEALLEVEKKVDPLEAFKKTNNFLDADSDSDLEIPLATLARVKRSKSLADDNQTVSNDPPKLSPCPNEPAIIIEQVQENTDSANDSYFSPSKPKGRAKKVRPTKDQKKEVTCEDEKARVKRKLIDPVKKRQTSHGFDEIIQKNMKLSCSICHVPLANFFLLRKHYHSVHNERGYATCCGRKFGKRGILVDHINTHLNPEYFKCVQCNRILSDRRSLEVHMNTHGTSKERIFQCNQCNKSFYRKLMLDHHMYTHIPERTFTCEECQKMFSSEFTLRRHINNVHNIAFLRICEQCGKSFRGLEIFRRHQLEHAGVPIPLVPCEKCGVKLTTKYGLRRHMESLHPETKIIHVCKTCGKKTPSAAGLQRHISYMHKCERNHKCPMCDKAFKKSYNLKPNKEDANSKVICCSCWNTLEGFHKFYLKVEEAYAKLVSIKLSKEDDGSCGDSYDAFPDTLAEDIKTESCDYFKNDITFAAVENSVAQPDHNQAKQTIKSDSESNDSSVVLSKRRKCPRRGRSKTISSFNAGITPGSEGRTRRKEDSAEEKPNTEIGSDWSANRSTDKQKKKATDEDSGYKSFTLQGGNQKRISCKQFDEVINQNMKLSCEICRKPLKSFFTLKEHYRCTHKEIGYVTCCDRKFNSRHALAHHILQHQNPDLFKCEKCGKMLSNYKSLNTHMKVHINDRRSFECDKCNKSFARKEKLERHMQTHVKVQRICEQCGKVTRALRQHQIREHSDMPRQRVQCQKCGVYLADASTLHTHMKYQHPQTKVTHVCNICGKISLTGYGLKRHIAYMHKYGRRHKCGLCEKAFKTAQKLRRKPGKYHLSDVVHGKMLCILCVTTSQPIIHIFQEEGCALNINEIIVKHFWLQPNANDENGKLICTSCWTALDSFHKFYLQVEEAHIKLRETDAVKEDELKVEVENVQQIDDTDAEPFIEVSADLLNADIKLEVSEDTEIKLPTELDLVDAVKVTDSQPSQPNKRKHSTDSKKSIAPPSSSTRSRTLAEKTNAENDFLTDEAKEEDDNEHFDRQNSSPDWQNHNSDNEDDDDDDDEDSDFEDSTSKEKPQKEAASRVVKKRGRPKKGEKREPSCKKKRTSDEQFKKMDRIREYDDIIAKNMKLSCTICLGISPNFAILKRHYRAIHNECGYAFCCGKKFRKRGVLVDHIYTHQNPEYFKCEKCGRVLANRKGLDCHMLTHNTEKQRIFQCDQCTLSFYTRPLLTRHLQTHISERNIKCPDCDKFFSTQDILRTHINNVHNASYTRICEQCGKSFRRPDAFKRHQLEHDGITQPLVPCKKCSVKLTSKYGLKRHMESMHPETEVTHVCSTCGKVAPSAAALQRHISYMHKMERKYKCPMCDKAFKKTGGLKPNKNDDNSKYICSSCWSALDSFHKFYQQVEEAHITLMKTIDPPGSDSELKQELGTQIEDVGSADFMCMDFLSADVKVEVKEDAEANLPQCDPLPEVEDKVNVSQIKSKRKALHDTSNSEDSESEIPLASLANSNKRRKAKAKLSENDDQDSSPEWQDHHSRDDDEDIEEDESDFEIKKRPIKQKRTSSATGKKRGRPCKNASVDTTPKPITEEQVKKRELSQEYDDIIQKNMKLSCTMCLIPLANFLILKKHYRTKHNARGYASCCGKKFLKRGILVDHIYTHLNPEHFKCDKCDKVLADRRCLDVHMNTHITEKQRIYQCDQCCKSFFKKPLLTRHLHIHIPQEERKFPCEECNKSFPSNYTLRAHINNVHQNAYAKICDQCGKSIRGREAFQRHLLEHAGVPIPSVQCDLCGAKLKNKYGLKRHINSVHIESNVPHVCNICGKVAPNPAALQRHYSYVHKCERNHKCPMCNKAFKKAGGLKEHMTIHTGEVLYTCPHCPKTFNSNANMHSHRKKMHRKEWEENRRHPNMGAAPTTE